MLSVKSLTLSFWSWQEYASLVAGYFLKVQLLDINLRTSALPIFRLGHVVMGFLGSMVLPLANAYYMNSTNITPSSLCSILVKDIIPLGRPLHHRDDDRGRAHPVPQCSSQETNKKHAHTLKPLNPFSQCIPPHKSVLERKNRAAVELPSDTKKTFAGDQESLSNYNASMRKVLFNNNNEHHINNERSCQSTGKKDAPSQRQGSYVKEREFALAFFKQLNENLKVIKRFRYSSDI